MVCSDSLCPSCIFQLPKVHLQGPDSTMRNDLGARLRWEKEKRLAIICEFCLAREPNLGQARMGWDKANSITQRRYTNGQ